MANDTHQRPRGDDALGAPDLRETPMASTLPAPDLQLRGRVVGKYILEDEIGRGGMGAVYRARHAFLGQAVAVKLCLGLGDESYREVLREGRAMAKLHDPHVVRVLDVGVEDGLGPYLVMELLTGRGLEHVIAEGPLEAGRAVSIAADLAFALRAAHQASLVHRDLKPSNVFLESTARGERAKVLDFGIVKPLAGSDQYVSTQGRIVGTPLYMSPEQWRSEPVTPKSDIWSFGVLVFEMLVGALPFDARSPWEMCINVNERDAPRVSSRREHVDPALDELVAECLSREPGRRPDAAQLATRLDDWRVARPRDLDHLASRSRRVPIAGLAVVAAAVLALAALQRAPLRMGSTTVQRTSPEPVVAPPSSVSVEPDSALAPTSSVSVPMPTAGAPRARRPAALPAPSARAAPAPDEGDVLRTKPTQETNAAADNEPLMRH